MTQAFYQDIISFILEEKPSNHVLDRKKIVFCKQHHIIKIPSNVDIFLHATHEQQKQLQLITKPTRTISGVNVVAIMSQPFACKHGRCIYCPGGPGSIFGDIPQSYTGKEPSTMRGLRNAWDPYLQVFNRLEQYVVIGQTPEKIEFIVQGGTFPSFPLDYQENFIMFALKAMNDFGELFYPNGELDFETYKTFFEMPGDLYNKERTDRVKQKILTLKNTNISTLAHEQERNETTKVRCTAMCLETRPDYGMQEDCNRMLSYGTTRVEMGVQTIYDDIMKKAGRMHDVKAVIDATHAMKDAFLKVGYHMMPGLPGSTREKDINSFKELFSNPDFQPDALKIYPTLVMPGTPLYTMYERGLYTPLSITDAADIIVEAKRYIPKYCRVMRVQRDIPSTIVHSGAKQNNLRQTVKTVQLHRGIICPCIRCREPRGRTINWNAVKILRHDYDASGGKEIFLSAEDPENDILIGFCRLRIPRSCPRQEITPTSAGIRELHVYGTATALGEEGDVQHRGWGRKLMIEAERIAKQEFKRDKMLVISGIGVREYYYKLGYVKDGVYVSKPL